MDNRSDGLWQGGPWEQPDAARPAPPAVFLPPPRRPVLRLRRRRRRRWPWFVGIAALTAAFCLVTIFLGQQLPSRFSSPGSPGESWQQEREHSTEPPDISQAQTGTGVVVNLLPPGERALSYRQIYQKSIPSRVSVEAESSTEYSSGTGVVLTQDGYIITNAHVVAGARAVRVALHDNRVLSASLVGFDAVEDLAVLKVEAEGLTPAEFGDSYALQPGDPVAALGDPLGYQASITDGIVSALDREVEVEGITMTLIQTSAAINFGNSGGPLLNEYGQVVGITTIKIVTDDGSAEGLGFAIPSQRVKYVVDTLIDGREVRVGVFGFTVSTLPTEEGGLRLIDVNKRSDAWAKGLRTGDILTAANGQPIASTRDLSRLKQTMGAGDAITLTYMRDGVSHQVEVELVDADLIG
ncbi:MAG: trypsin-like serine protease [Lawsonibacter sp.]|nr:trypsin-like serine protease [Lawsonibacter sp.]